MWAGRAQLVKYLNLDRVRSKLNILYSLSVFQTKLEFIKILSSFKSEIYWLNWAPASHYSAWLQPQAKFQLQSAEVYTIHFYKRPETQFC